MSDTANFEPGFLLWRRIIANVPSDKKLFTFENACAEIAGMCARGLARADAADELHEMAVTSGLLIEHADEDVIQDLIARAFKHIDEKPKANGRDPRPEPPPEVLPLIDIRAWFGVEPKPRQWIVQERIPDRNVTLLSGQGGVGKTLLMQQLAVATVLARDWIGVVPEPGPVLFITAEDDEDELHFRYDRIAKYYETDFNALAAAGLNLLSVAGKDAVMAIADNKGIVKPTELFHTMERSIAEIRPRWIGLDTAADIFIVNERDRSQVRQCISLLRGIALKYQCAVILLSHPSLTGISSGTGLSGSTAWNNSVRSRLYLKTEKKKGKDEDEDEADEDADQGSARILEFMKSNYSALAKPVRLRWKDGLLLPENTSPTLTPIDQAALQQRARDVFLALLRQYNKQDRTVSDKPTSRNFAPVEFGEKLEVQALHPNRQLRKKLLCDAMAFLLDNDKISLGQGPMSLPPSKRYQCLYVAGQLI